MNSENHPIPRLGSVPAELLDRDSQAIASGCAVLLDDLEGSFYCKDQNHDHTIAGKAKFLHLIGVDTREVDICGNCQGKHGHVYFRLKPNL